MLLFDPRHLFIYFIAADRIERCVLFNNRLQMKESMMEIDQSMFHYVEVTAIDRIGYEMWRPHIDRINNAFGEPNPNLTVALAMYMKKNRIPAVKNEVPEYI